MAELAGSHPRQGSAELVPVGWYALLATVALGLRLLIASYDPGWFFTDTSSYLEVAGTPISAVYFWAGQRPVTLPLLFKLLGVNSGNFQLSSTLTLVGRAQAVIGAFCWTFLAGVVAVTLRLRWVQISAFALVQAFGLSLHVSMWDSLLLSESLATSTFVLLVGLWIVGVSRAFQFRGGAWWGGPLYWGSLAVVTALYSFARDANAYFLLGAAGLSLASLLVPKVRFSRLGKGLLGVAILSMLVVGLHQWSLAESRRWRGAFYGTFLQRIYGFSQARDYFIAEGMPQGEWQEEVAPRMRRVDFFDRVQRDRSARPFVKWMDREGQWVYAKYLLTHPRILLSGPARHYRMLLSPLSTEYRSSDAKTPGWLRLGTAILYPRPDWVLFPAVGLVAAGVLTTLVRGAARPWWAVPLLLWALVPPMMLLVWHGDSIEIERHAYQLGLQVRLGGWLLVLALIDTALQRSAVRNP